MPTAANACCDDAKGDTVAAVVAAVIVVDGVSAFVTAGGQTKNTHKHRQHKHRHTHRETHTKKTHTHTHTHARARDKKNSFEKTHVAANNAR